MSTEQESQALEIWTHPAPVAMVPVAEDTDNTEGESEDGEE